jgi:hypothetical protein
MPFKIDYSKVKLNFGQPARYRVGDKVKFMYGTTPVVTEIAEDRGPLGRNGGRMYGLWYTLSDSEPTYTEMAEEDLEPAA